MPSNTPAHFLGVHRDIGDGSILTLHVPWKDLSALTGFEIDYLQYIGLAALWEEGPVNREMLYATARKTGSARTRNAIKTSYGRVFFDMQVRYSNGIFRFCGAPLRAEKQEVVNF